MSAGGIIRSFEQMLGLLSRGAFVKRCDDHLQEALSTLASLPAGKGSVTMTITLKVNYDQGRVDVQPAVKSKLPEASFAGTPFWEHEGSLSVQHPSQIDMFGGPRSAEEREAAQN